MHPLLRYWVAAALTAGAVAAAAASPTIAPEMREHLWTESDGRQVRLASLPGPVVVMSMAFTTCRKVCNATALTMSEIQQRLDALNVDADFVIVGYDPENDSPSDWSDWRVRRKLTRGNWHFLSGDPGTTRKLAHTLGLDFWAYDEHIVHDFRIVLFDAQWRKIAEIDQERAGDIARIIAGIAASLPAARAIPR